MGAVEEGGKVATGIVEALRASPVMLVILLINVAVVGFLFYQEHQQAHRATEVRDLVKQMFDTCLKRTMSSNPEMQGSLVDPN